MCIAIWDRCKDRSDEKQSKLSQGVLIVLENLFLTPLVMICGRSSSVNPSAQSRNPTKLTNDPIKNYYLTHRTAPKLNLVQRWQQPKTTPDRI